MKILVSYYSRTGTTKKVAEMIATKLNADIEEIKDTVDRNGVKGYFRCGREAMQRLLTKLEPFARNLKDYDLVVIGTPIWGWNMSSPTRTFVTMQKENFQNVAFFCTMGGSGDKKAFSEMEEIIGKKPETTLALKTKEVVAGDISGKVEEFLKKIHQRN